MSEGGFRCSRCGGAIHELPTFAWDYPMPVLYVPAEQRGARVTCSADTCIIDGRFFFIRGCVEIPVQGRAAPFIWGVWAEVSAQDYERYLASPDTAAPFTGRLPCVPPIYPDSEPEVDVQPRTGLRPLFLVRPADHPIAVHQREGLSPAQVLRIAEDTVHPKRHE